jgi:hypothetical protein
MRSRTGLSAVALAIAMATIVGAGCRMNARPNCDKMRACCAALARVENGLPREHEILCHHDPELDEGCVDTLGDIARFTPSKSLPSVCK